MKLTLTQLSIFVENRPGRLFSICSLLGDGGINIRAITIAESEGFGILRIIVDRPDDALDILKMAGYTANVADIVAVDIVDRPGGLAEVLRVLNDAGINVEYMYGFVDRSSDNALVAFRFENPDDAVRILKSNDIRVVGNKIPKNTRGGEK
jgi:hypothetical protein